MINYREILRLHRFNYSQRAIASSVHSSHDKIGEVIHLAAALVDIPLRRSRQSGVAGATCPD